MGRPLPPLLLGHGASGTALSMRPWIDALAAQGVLAEALDLPKSNPDRAVGVFRDALAAQPGAALGGHSFGWAERTRGRETLIG